MRRHPVENHPDAGLVAGVDERGELVRRAITRTRRELRQQLITPRTAERVFHDRHQFDVGEAQVFDIGNQSLGQFRPGVLAGHFTQVVQLALPRTRVQFVDRQGRRHPLMVATGQHPVLVLPVDFQRRGDFRGGVRRQAGGQRHRVGLQRQDAVGTENFVLVGVPRLQARDEQLPDPGGMPQAHRMAAPVPDVEITDHRHPPGIGCPHRETHTVDAVHGLELGTEARTEVAVIAFGKQVQIHVAQQGAEAVRVFGRLLATGPTGAQQIRLRAVEMPGKQPRRLCGLKTPKRFARAPGQNFYTQGAWQIGADELSTGTITVGAKYGEGIDMLGAHQCIDIPCAGQQRFFVMTLFLVRDTHDYSPPRSEKGLSPLNNPYKPCNGTGNQAGRFSAS
ncbi:hypothetical protein D3C75_468000 [compost metagenome]